VPVTILTMANPLWRPLRWEHWRARSQGEEQSSETGQLVPGPWQAAEGFDSLAFQEGDPVAPQDVPARTASSAVVPFKHESGPVKAGLNFSKRHFHPTGQRDDTQVVASTLGLAVPG
jgi:hypothetical protein